jgi:hypothetical protein
VEEVRDTLLRPGRKKHRLLDGSQALHACPSDKDAKEAKAVERLEAVA